jgi:hypothetical protein
MTPFAREESSRQYEPSEVWDQTARAYASVLSGRRDDTRDDAAVQSFGTVDNGLVSLRVPLRLEDAARVAATMSISGLRPDAVLERAIATQWFLDKQMSTGLELVLHGDRRFRRSVRLPMSPQRWSL